MIPAPPSDEQSLQVAAAADAWHHFWLRVRGITPSALARFALSIGAIVVLGDIVLSAWVSLLPFLVGLVLAYLVLPLVDLLDRVLPRWLAALVVTLGELLIIVAVVALLVPPLVVETPLLVQALPGANEVRTLIADARTILGSLPPEVQAAMSGGAQIAASQIQTNLTGVVQVALSLFAASLIGILGTLGFVLGFIAVPTWLLGVLTDRRAGARGLDRVLPAWLRPDFWAVLSIIDRTFGSYLRGQIIRALVFGSGLYLAFSLLNRYELAGTRFPLWLTVFAMITYLIPDIGPIIGVVPAVLAALTRSPHEALIVLATYISVSLLEQHLVAPRLEERSIDIHPVILLPLLIAVSQFGFLWVVVAAPLIVVARDLFRYAYGRLGSPPRPAGVLPDEPWPAPVRITVPLRPRHMRPGPPTPARRA